MCVMSHSVMAYHGDRSLAASIRMMEVGVGGKSRQDGPGRRRGVGTVKLHPKWEVGGGGAWVGGGGWGTRRTKVSLFSWSAVSGRLCL